MTGNTADRLCMMKLSTLTLAMARIEMPSKGRLAQVSEAEMKIEVGHYKRQADVSHWTTMQEMGTGATHIKPAPWDIYRRALLR